MAARRAPSSGTLAGRNGEPAGDMRRDDGPGARDKPVRAVQLGIDLASLVTDGRTGSREGSLLLPAVVSAEDQVVATGQHGSDEALCAAGATAGPAVRA